MPGARHENGKSRELPSGYGEDGVALGAVPAIFDCPCSLTRRWLARLDTWVPRRGDAERAGGLPVAPLTVVLLVVLLAACFTDFVGIHSVLGAFVAGLVMPRGELVEQIRQRFEPLVGYLLLPAFFIYTGLNTKLGVIVEPAVVVMTAVVLVVSFAGKFGAVGLVARTQGMGWREAGAMGALANARGLMELVLLHIGLTAGLITLELYTILVVMTTVTTFIATPVQRMFERSAWKNGRVFGPTGEEPKPLAEPSSAGESNIPCRWRRYPGRTRQGTRSSNSGRHPRTHRHPR
ncbi:cation:proton antiporter [Nocardia sp. CWNU-33]|uniref:cation:proton antiporter n=1 Tax=Nocardia sp. CWNU-33 TaxID=3392117 RepID=UPI00398F4B8F